MTVPRLSSNHRKRRPGVGDAMLCFIAAFALMTLLSIFGPTLYMVDQQQHATVNERQNVPGPKKSAAIIIATKPPDISVYDIEADIVELDHEDWFGETIKSCLPAGTEVDNEDDDNNKKNDNNNNKDQKDKCGQFIPEPLGNDKKKVQRVAVISPPGDVSGALVKHVEQIMQRHNKLQQQNKVDLDIDIVETSHVPPYGYGKSHGLTKVIRIVPQPIILEVTDALQSVLEPGETHAMITLADLKAALRQILRFHCRLSHLAAHTALLSVELMDLIAEPGDVVEQLEHFLTPHDVKEKHHHNNNADGNIYNNNNNQEEDEEDAAAMIADDDQNGEFEAHASYGAQTLAHVQSISNNVNVVRVLDQVLQEELMSTKNLTQWPCPSFWAAGDAPDPTKISPLVQRLAQRLSPDCKDPYSSCWVERDKCEARGDALCPKDDKSKQATDKKDKKAG